MKKTVLALAITAAIFTPHLAEAGAYTLARGAFAGLADWTNAISTQDADIQVASRDRRVWTGTSKTDGFVKLDRQPAASSSRS